VAKKKPGSWARLRKFAYAQRRGGELLDLFMESVALEMRIVFLLLDALGHGLLIPEREITGDGFTLFFGFCAL
jgi:hypothetical protein